MRFAALLLPLVALPSTAVAQKHYSELEFPPLREIVVPEVERAILPNGLTLYLLEDHSLPKVEGRVLVRTGSRLVPAEEAGLASVLGQVMRTGGSTSRSGEEVDRVLENAGSMVETSVGTTAGSASLFSLKEHLPVTLEILAELLRSPALPEDKIELAKMQERAAIARRNDDVSGIASREFQKLLYGEDSPYARTTEYATIAAISRQDLQAFHDRSFVPNRTFLGLWGDFDAREMRDLVEEHFGSWQPGEEASEPPRAPAPGRGRSIHFILKDDVNQSQLRIGHLDGRYDDPDYFALSLMAEILGGGFSSRLFQAVRSQRGLAYSVRAAWNASYDYDGTFSVASSTKSESTVETIRAILDEIERMASEPVSEEELQQAKDGILNSFVFNFDSEGEIVTRLMTYDYYGYPRDFLGTYQENIERVTVDEVSRAAREHLRPDDLVVLAVGREEDFDEPLSSLGEVHRIDVTIPPPPAEATPEATPESLAAGRDIVRRFASAYPDFEGFSLTGESVLSTPQGELPADFDIQFAAPDRYREASRLPFGEIVTVVHDEKAWASTPRGVQELDADQRARTRQGAFRHYPGLVWAAAKERVEAQLLSSEEGKSTVLLDVEGARLRATFEEETGRLVELSLPGTNLQGAPVEERRVFSDFEDGFPSVIEIFHDGELAARTRIEATRLDPPVDDALFARPERSR